MLSVAAPRRLTQRLADGVELVADHWGPAVAGRYPVLLMRQPYGRRIASTLVFAHPAWYAAHGYHVLVQDVRGSGDSDGTFRLFADEAADGAAAVAWAADLPGSTGRVGMYGFSYQGNTQYLAMAGGGNLHAASPAMTGWDMFNDWAWEGGAFRLGPNLGWGAQMGWIRAMHDGDMDAAASFQAAARNPPVGGPHRTMPEVMRRFGALTHYPDWLQNDAPGPYWDGCAARALIGDDPPSVPMLHVGGWFDQMLMGTLDGHAALSKARRAPQRLVVGPWQHQPWGRRVGAMDLGAEASSNIDEAQLAWFARFLKDDDETWPLGAPVTLFDIGEKSWRGFDAWPVTTPTPLYLTGNGLSAATTTDGRLTRDAPRPGWEWFVHDPWRPVPTMGGHAGAPGGIQDRASIDDRTDVACFTWTQSVEKLFLCGRVHAFIQAEADQQSFDLSVVLSMVTPDGRVWNLTQGHMRCDTPGEIMVPMRAVCVTVPPGNALRLSVAGSCYPGYAVNPGSGARAMDFTMEEERVITIALRTGRARVVLPVVVHS
jgi:uncharacterized protein